MEPSEPIERPARTVLSRDGRITLYSMRATETVVRLGAGAVLRRELRARQIPKLVRFSTDPYHVLEERYALMPAILAALADFAAPVTMTTRSLLIARDIEVLVRLAHAATLEVIIAVATLDESVARDLDGSASPRALLRVAAELADAGLTVRVINEAATARPRDPRSRVEAVVRSRTSRSTAAVRAFARAIDARSQQARILPEAARQLELTLV